MPDSSLTSTSLTMKAVKDQLGDAIPVFREILEHMKCQNARLRILIKMGNWAVRLMVLGLVLSFVVVCAMVYQTVQQREANTKLEESKLDLEHARKVNLQLKKSLDDASVLMQRLLSEQAQTQKQVKRVAEDVPKVTVDKKGKLKVEVAVDPEAAKVSRPPTPNAASSTRKKAAINIDSGRIEF